MTAASRYHSPLREEQAAATRSRILDACLALMRTGADLTYSAVATRAGVQERTVYRHFPTRGDLEAGLWTWIRDHLTHVDFSADNTDDLVKALHRSFSGFDADNPLRSLGELNFWVNSHAYNTVEMAHHVWLLAAVDRLAREKGSRD